MEGKKQHHEIMGIDFAVDGGDRSVISKGHPMKTCEMPEPHKTLYKNIRCLVRRFHVATNNRLVYGASDCQTLSNADYEGTMEKIKNLILNIMPEQKEVE